MRPAGIVLVLCAAAAMAAAAPQASAGTRPIQFVCSRSECSCEDLDGLEMVTCDCSTGGSNEHLMLGARSEAYLSDRTRSLRVHNCSHVSLVSEALSNAISLVDLELSDIASLELQASSLYTEGGPRRRVTVQRVADLQVHEEAFSQVTQLQELNIAEVVTGPLPLDGLPDGADVVNMHISDSVAEDVRILVDKSDNVTVSKCKLDSLSISIGDVLSVAVTDNTIKKVDTLRINARPNAHSTDSNNMTLVRNTISSMDSWDVEMTLDTIEIVNNTIGSLLAPLRVEFTTAAVKGNEVGRLGASVFSEFVRLDPVNLRFGESSEEFAFTFAENTLRASANGSYGLFLTPADEKDSYSALYRIYGNRFACRCEELKELVSAGEEEYLKDDDEDHSDGLFQLEDVYGALYSSSRCVEGNKALDQYRLLSYSDDFECLKTVRDDSGASSAVAGALTILLAASAALGMAV
ncbi:uncharacterized protein LOC122388641 [Amphibalanus amphitrite]|nr:uncharacterized protein LOC122388641 [Amphibalanus amphitrite]